MGNSLKNISCAIAHILGYWQLSVCGRHTDISSINNLLSLPFEYKLKRSVACRFWCVFCLSKWLSNGYPRRLCQTKTRELTGVAKRGQRGERLSHLRRFSLRAAVSVLLYEPQMEKHTTQNRQLDRLHTLLRKPVVSIQLVCNDFVSKRPETVVDCKPTRC